MAQKPIKMHKSPSLCFGTPGSRPTCSYVDNSKDPYLVRLSQAPQRQPSKSNGKTTDTLAGHIRPDAGGICPGLLVPNGGGLGRGPSTTRSYLEAQGIESVSQYWGVKGLGIGLIGDV